MKYHEKSEVTGSAFSQTILELENAENVFETLLKHSDYFSSEPGPLVYHYVPLQEYSELQHYIITEKPELLRKYQQGKLVGTENQKKVEIILHVGIHETARTSSLLNNYRWTAKQIISQYLDAVIKSLIEGNTLELYLNSRCLIEKIANINLAILDLDMIVKEQSQKTLEYVEAANFLVDLGQVIGKRSKATRFDWRRLSKTESIRHKKVNSPEEPKGVQIHEAEQLLKGVDKLSKSFVGTRNVYEFLCEFMHPNYGQTILFIADDLMAQGYYDVRHRKRVNRREEPIAFWIQMQNIHYELLELLGELSGHAANIDKQLKKMHFGVGRVAKRYVAESLAHNPQLFHPLDYCPCGTGKMIRKCCGRKLKVFRSRQK